MEDRAQQLKKKKARKACLCGEKLWPADAFAGVWLQKSNTGTYEGALLAPSWPPSFTGEEGKCPRGRQHSSAAQWMTRNEKCWAGGGKGKGGFLLAASRLCQIQCQGAHGLGSPGQSASPRDAGKRWLNTLTHQPLLPVPTSFLHQAMVGPRQETTHPLTPQWICFFCQ